MSDANHPDAPATGTRRYLRAAATAGKRRASERDAIRKTRFDTIAVHGLYSMHEALQYNQGAIIEPIYMSSSQGYRDADEMEAALAYQVPTWGYARIANPTLYYLEGTLALLEAYGFDGDAGAHVTASGMAAIFSATDPFLAVGDAANDGAATRSAASARAASARPNFVTTAQVYGGTFQLFNARYAQERGIDVRWVKDPTNLDEWLQHIDANTRFLYGELPSNPGLQFFDIRQVAEIAHAHGVPLIIDSTVATPALLRPLQHGADIVVQSVTKTMTSSGFGLAGAVIARKNLTTRFRTETLAPDFTRYLKGIPNRDYGPNLSPIQAALSLNDLRTLRSKVDQFSRSSERVAAYLAAHPKVESVNYLGLRDHPLHALASQYMQLVDAEHDTQYGSAINRYGHLMSFCVRGGAQAARDTFSNLQRIWRATDLGRVKTVAAIPAISTHQQQGEAGRTLAGIPGNLIRLAVGGEHPDDVIADLDQALASIGKAPRTRSVPSDYSVGGASGRD